MAQRARRAFYRTDPVSLARRLLGCTLVRQESGGVRLSAMIVETEAYLGVEDAAAHSYKGRRSARNESMYGPPGTAYVYFTYGMHHCFNIVAGAPGEPVAALIRAAEPLEGVKVMLERRSLGRARRSRAPGPLPALRASDLCSGPAKLCEAFGLDRAFDGLDLAGPGSPVWIEPAAALGPEQIATSRRIGVAYAGAWARRRLRFLIRANPHVSVPA
ncbi:MAG: DNA-3-methyladenine glycosylase [Phycisphaerales bacterium JB039]